ncbi:hypothetical protein TNCV_1694371 [Trichonephila clavipes]|nr:hypothetical protein TNCV_1694371 [Trichonephila clavipes]
MINGRTRLHVVANGTMTGQRYIDEVLLPHVRLFRGAVGDKFVFMDNNVQHVIEHSPFRIGLDSEGSPNVSQVAGRNYPPTNKNTLIRALTEEWDKLPQQLLDNVVQKVCNCPAVQARYIPEFSAIRGSTDRLPSGPKSKINLVDWNSSCQNAIRGASRQEVLD